MINPKTPTAYREDFRAVASVEAVDPYTLRVRYKQPYAKALQSWGIWMLPKHVLEPYVREGRLREAPQNRANPVGTGAYRFKEWKPGEKVVLVANPGYFEGQPGFATSTTFRSEEHTSELQSHSDLVCRLLLENKKDDR